MNNALLSTNRRLQREKKRREGLACNDLYQKRTTRKIKTKRYYKKICSHRRSEMISRLEKENRYRFYHLLGTGPEVESTLESTQDVA